MKLIRPSPGELADRQTILELKINHADIEIGDEESKLIKTKKGSANVVRTVIDNPTKVNVQPFFDELELVQTRLKENWIPNITMHEEAVKAYDDLYEQLAKTNEQLWDLEDQARVLRDAPDKFQELACKRAAEVLFTITDLNERRASLVQEINKIWKITSQEKLY
jgi:hypothetical protein